MQENADQDQYLQDDGKCCRPANHWSAFIHVNQRL